MALLNHAKKELSAKIVYYGPGLSGKTTNLEWIHRKLAPDKRGKLISLETKTDRTLFFDFLPVQIGEIHGFRTRFNVYTVPGQIFYNETRRMVLKGVDGIVFVADSQKEMANENLENLKNLAENLRSIGKELSKMPLVLQFNKRDLPNILSVEEMNRLLNAPGLPFFEAVAVKGEGVLTTLTRVTRVVADHLKQNLFASPKEEASGPRPSPAAAPRGRPEPALSSPVSPTGPSGLNAPAFLDKQPEAERESGRQELQVLSKEQEITRHSPMIFERSPCPTAAPLEPPSAGGIEAQPAVADRTPNLGDLGAPVEFKRTQQPTPALAFDAKVAPRKAATPKGHAEPASSGAPSTAYWMDPSLVTVAAEAVSAPPDTQQTVALRFGDPERESGNQVRIPVALRLAGSNEIVSFQMVIRIEHEPGAS